MRAPAQVRPGQVTPADSAGIVRRTIRFAARPFRAAASRITYRDLAFLGTGAAAARIVDELGASDGGLLVASVTAVLVAARALTILRERHG